MKKIFIIFILSCFALTSNALTIQELFRALKKQPVTRIDKLVFKSASYSKTKAISNLYPKIYGAASIEHFNIPTSVAPLTPSQSANLTKAGGAFPFSTTIKQIGVEVSVPLFVYPLFSLAKKAEEMQKSAKEKMRINFLRNEAAIVTLNAKLQYLEELRKAMLARIASVNAQLKTIELSVKLGRTPEIQVLKIKNIINQLYIDVNQIEISRQSVIAAIENLTSIKLKHSVAMVQIRCLKEHEFVELKPLKYTVKARFYEVKSNRAKLYPSFYLKGFIFRKFGVSYNTDQSVIKNYGSLGIYIQIPIFDKTIYADVEKSKSDYLKSVFQLRQLKIELVSEAESLDKELKLLKKSVYMAKKSVENQKRLLEYAKVAFKMKRMTEEEYLRYEDELLNAQANLFGFEAKKWEDLGKLAVIYGNNLEEIVK